MPTISITVHELREPRISPDTQKDQLGPNVPDLSSAAWKEPGVQGWGGYEDQGIITNQLPGAPTERMSRDTHGTTQSDGTEGERQLPIFPQLFTCPRYDGRR